MGRRVVRVHDGGALAARLRRDAQHRGGERQWPCPGGRRQADVHAFDPRAVQRRERRAGLTGHDERTVAGAVERAGEPNQGALRAADEWRLGDEQHGRYAAHAASAWRQVASIA